MVRYLWYALLPLLSACGNEPPAITQQPIINNTCSIEEVRTVRGSSMLGLFATGDDIIIEKGYYNCHAVKREDIVVIQRDDNLGKKNWIKIVYGVPGDTVTLNVAQDTLLINDNTVQNVKGEVYKVDKVGASYIRLSQQTQMRNNVIPRGHYLVLGTVKQGGWDSRRIGLVSLNQIIARVKHNPNLLQH